MAKILCLPQAEKDKGMLWVVYQVCYARPDKGGDPERFKRLQKAYDYAKQVKGVK